MNYMREPEVDEALRAEYAPAPAAIIYIAGDSPMRAAIAAAMKAAGGVAYPPCADAERVLGMQALIGDSDCVLVIDDASFKAGQAVGIAMAMHKPVLCLDSFQVSGAQKIGIEALTAASEAEALTEAETATERAVLHGWANVLQAIVEAVEAAPVTWRVDVSYADPEHASYEDSWDLRACSAQEAACDAVVADDDFGAIVLDGEVAHVTVWRDGEPDHAQRFMVSGSYLLEAEEESAEFDMEEVP